MKKMEEGGSGGSGMPMRRLQVDCSDVSLVWVCQVLSVSLLGALVAESNLSSKSWYKFCFRIVYKYWFEYFIRDSKQCIR